MQEAKHIHDVKEFFDQTDIYLVKNFNLTIRKELIENWTLGQPKLKIVDFGCGNGELSKGLAQSHEVTLMDLSENMLELAQRNFQEHGVQAEEIICCDIDSWEPKQTYDLVICCGVLAHCPSIENAMTKITNCLKPNGKVILQFTNANSFMGRFRLTLAKILKRNKNHHSYQLNKITDRKILELLNKWNFEILDQFTYNLFIPKFSFVPNKVLYHITKISLKSPFSGAEVMLYAQKNIKEDS